MYIYWDNILEQVKEKRWSDHKSLSQSLYLVKIDGPFYGVETLVTLDDKVITT